MLVLLPPSEAKAAPESGAALEPAGLSSPSLTPARLRVLDAVTDLCAGDEERARRTLGLTPGQAAEVRRNAGLRDAPTAAAGTVYTGVLYDALDLPTLAGPAAELVRRSALVFSGLWGVLRLDDRIPAYRCPVGVRLPGVGRLGPYWKGQLDAAVTAAAAGGMVLDLRSAAYAAMWRPTGGLAERTAAVRIWHERTVDGQQQRSVVSHFNKATKGRLLRALATAGVDPGTPDELVTALRDLKYTVERVPDAAGRPCRLDVVVAEL